MRIARLTTVAVLAMGLFLVAGAAQAKRIVFVNGQQMSPQQIATLDRMQCTYIPNGNYWLNVATGAWGYAGNPWRQGFLGDLCRRGGGGGGGQRHKSLSERGLLYTPGDLNFR